LDVISAFATDGRIEAYDLALLTDDREAFPPYYAAPVVRIQALQAYPELRGALAPLDGLIDDATMRRLNFRVDERGESPADVARGFLRSQQLLK
jgi:glycine betaine/choline ABC-type transport system substrate-binding protein